jgi:hypothetical protein
MSLYKISNGKYRLEMFSDGVPRNHNYHYGIEIDGQFEMRLMI